MHYSRGKARAELTRALEDRVELETPLLGRRMNSLRMMQSTCRLFRSNGSMTSPCATLGRLSSWSSNRRLTNCSRALPLTRRSQNAVVSGGQTNTERMLKGLFGALGFEHGEAVFAEPPPKR